MMALTRDQFSQYQRVAKSYFDKAGIILTPQEENAIEIADFGLEDFEEFGLALITYVNTDRCCAKELVLLPEQSCPEHFHPPIPSLNYEGKEETFRCRWGEVYLYVSGEPTPNPLGSPPASRREWFTVQYEIVLRPGEQYTIIPQTWHWFQGGRQGAVVSEFSTRSVDEADIFRDPAIQRIPKILDQ
jgi:D-lyxose ketol-isomerase